MTTRVLNISHKSYIDEAFSEDSIDDR